MVTVSLVFILLNWFLFQLNALMPSCSVETFVLNYLKCNLNYYNDGTPLEAQRTIDKRTMSLKVQFCFLCRCRCRCVNIGTNQQLKDCLEICSDLSALGHVKELSIKYCSVCNFEDTVCKAWRHQLKWLKVIL
jgi:hypothetical protein